MNAARESVSQFSPVLPGDSVEARTAVWALPSFDELVRPRAAPPPSAQFLEDLEAEASREGHARGYADGYAQGAAAARDEAERLREVLVHLAAPVAQIDAGTEQALVALMLELARRLVQQELAAEPIKVLGIVRDAVAHLAQPTRGLRVHLNPEDARVVAEHLRNEPSDEQQWQIVADRALMPGDCVVQSDSARVDARLDTRQAQLAQRLLGEGV